MATLWGNNNGIHILEVANGFIVSIGNEQYVFSSLKQTLKFVEETFEGRKK